MSRITHHGQQVLDDLLSKANDLTHPIRNNGNLGLEQCLRQLCGLERDLYLHHHYIDSQFLVLWDTLALVEAPAARLQADWHQRHQESVAASQAIEDKVRTLIEHSAPQADDFTCAICLAIFTDPITLPACLHTFCKSCLDHANKTVCPLCRSPFRLQDCSVNVSLSNFIRFFFPPEPDLPSKPCSRRRSMIHAVVRQWSVRPPARKASIREERPRSFWVDQRYNQELLNLSRRSLWF
ncbi:hypothetical protein DFQ28_002437 [Apophysomyces sp. BC1034]|nr:hypothetical protein DFQ30_000486 [Apophysomyces sp. BC1015]KAG0190157.1 hypothetical protein DFQ28_002437 [Apophysomyces sp. BC1034]